MKGTELWVVFATVVAMSVASSPVSAQIASDDVPRQDYFLVGTEVGATGALEPLRRFVDNGAAVSPFAAYMFNRYIGILGQVNMLALPNKQNDPLRLEDDVTWGLGAAVGPRLALPLGGVEIWGTFQVGFLSALSPNSPISGTPFAISTGGGMNIALTKKMAFGLYGRYNRLYQDAYGAGDVRYASGGINLTYKLPPPSEGLPPPK